MIIHSHREFKKLFQNQHPKIQQAFYRRRDFFVNDIFHPLLNNHALTGRWEGWRSFNVTGDVRVIFKKLSGKEYLFYMIGTHAELY